MKLSKTSLLTVLGAALLLAALAYFSTLGKSGPVETLVIESGNGIRHGFTVEIADTPEKQETGLMFRTHMAPGHGMLFEFDRTDILRFWMKNTLIPLDMLFIAADGEIKKIHENAVPGSLAPVSSEVPVAAVLEINGGQARALGIATGDRVTHPFFKNNDQ